MSNSKKVCKICKSVLTKDYYKIYNSNEEFICKVCLSDPDNGYGKCFICEQEYREIAYDIDKYLFVGEDDNYYCEEHRGNGDGNGGLSENMQDYIEHIS